MSKYHYDKNKLILTADDHLEIQENISVVANAEVEAIEKNKAKKQSYKTKKVEIFAPRDRIIVVMDTDEKNWHNLGFGKTIELRRDVEQLNYRIKTPVNCILISSNNYIPFGSEIICSYLAIHPTNLIYGLEEDIEIADVHYYSILESDCYIWRENKDQEWKPCNGYALGLRLYEPYKGDFLGIEPKELKDYLYVTSESKSFGLTVINNHSNISFKNCDLKGKVVKTLKSALYECILQGKNGREESVIRVRHWDYEDNPREEFVMVDLDKTKMVENGDLIVGVDIKSAKKNISICQKQLLL